MRKEEISALIPQWDEMWTHPFSTKKEKKKLRVWQYVFYASTKASLVDSNVWERWQAKNKWNCPR